MPDNPAGVYSLPPSYKVANGDLTDASQHNPPFEDVQQALTNRLHRDGRTAWTGNQNANGNRMTGLAEAVDANDAVIKSQLDDLGIAIGDGKWSVRDLGEGWLRRNGALYDVDDYPELAALLPPLPDGVQWQNLNVGLSGVKYLLVEEDRFLLQYFSGSSGTNTFIYASEDGVTYSQVAEIAIDALTDFSAGLGIYAIAGGAGKVSVSNDGVSWSSPVTTMGGGIINGIAIGADVIVAVGNGGAIYTSPDGATWTSRTSGTSNVLLKVRFVNDVFVAVGATGTIVTSPDGINWTVRTSGVTTAFRDVTHGNGLYVAVGSGGVIRTSPDLAIWTGRTSGTTQDFYGVTYSSAGFLAVGDVGTARISAADSGTSWATTVTGVSSRLLQATFDPNEEARYYVTVQSSTTVLKGTRTLTTQFQVPNNDPTYGWIRAL